MDNEPLHATLCSSASTWAWLSAEMSAAATSRGSSRVVSRLADTHVARGAIRKSLGSLLQ